MSVYGFNEQSVAEHLKNIAKGGVSFSPLSSPSVAFMYLTPSGGIPARSGTTLGKADCTPYWLAVDSSTGDCTLEVMQYDGTDIEDTTIYNASTTAVAGDSYIFAFECFNVLVAIWEDCGS